MEIINEAGVLRSSEVPPELGEAEEDPQGTVQPKEIEGSGEDEPPLRRGRLNEEHPIFVVDATDE